MGTSSFVNRQRIIKLFIVVGIVELAVFLAWTPASFAKPSYRPGSTYCSCSCVGNDGRPIGGLEWDTRAGEHCRINGKNCKKDGQPGTLANCQTCKVDRTGGSACTPTKGAAGAGKLPEPGGMAPPTPQPPKRTPTVPEQPPTTR